MSLYLSHGIPTLFTSQPHIRPSRKGSPCSYSRQNGTKRMLGRRGSLTVPALPAADHVCLSVKMRWTVLPHFMFWGTADSRGGPERTGGDITWSAHSFWTLSYIIWAGKISTINSTIKARHKLIPTVQNNTSYLEKFWSLSQQHSAAQGHCLTLLNFTQVGQRHGTCRHLLSHVLNLESLASY